LQFADQKPASVCILIAISVHISGRFTYETELIRSYKFLCKKQYKQKKEHLILTGDRPTGPLHIGHYVGSLRNRVSYQHQYKQYIMIADAQALTDNMDNPVKVHNNVIEVALDYLAVGIDPSKTTILFSLRFPN
jgi:tryptophanyl-tRNA synthetase